MYYRSDVRGVSPIISVVLIIAVVVGLVTVGSSVLFNFGETNTPDNPTTPSFQFERLNNTSVLVSVDGTGEKESVSIVRGGGGSRQVSAEFGERYIVGNQTNPVQKGESIIIQQGQGTSQEIINSYDPPGEPEVKLLVITGDATVNNDTSLTVYGNLDTLVSGSADVLIQYRKQGETTWNNTTKTTQSSIGIFQKKLTDLSQNTTYEYRAVAETDKNRDNGTVETAKTTGSVLIETKSPSNIGSKSAELRGNLSTLGGADSAEYYFRFRVIGNKTWNQTNNTSVTSSGIVTQTATELQSDTKYETQAVVNASDSENNTGKVITFSTNTDNQLRIKTVNVTSIDTNAANFTGNLTDLAGASSAESYFRYRDRGDTTLTDTANETLSTPSVYTISTSGLVTNTTYEVEAIANGSNGKSSTGSFIEFTTDTRINVNTGNVSDIASDSAKVDGKLTDLGGANNSSARFYFRKQGDSVWSETIKFTLDSETKYTDNLKGLSASTTYEYKSVVNGSDGDNDTGQIKTFTTADSPASPIMFVHDNPNSGIQLIFENDTAKNVSLEEPQSIGGRPVDFDDDGLDEAVYVRSSDGYIRMVDRNNETGTIATDTNRYTQPITADYDGDGDVGIMWSNSNNKAYYTDSNTPPTSTGVIAANVLGYMDFNEDGDKDLVFVTESSVIKYRDNGSIQTTGQKAYNPLSVGSPASYGKNGKPRVPYRSTVDLSTSGYYLFTVNSKGDKKQYTSFQNVAPNTSMTFAAVTDNGQLEVLFHGEDLDLIRLANESAQQRYKFGDDSYVRTEEGLG